MHQKTTPFRLTRPRPARMGKVRAMAVLAALSASLPFSGELRGTDISVESPFLAGPGVERGGGKTAEVIQLSGITSIGSQSYACIADSARKSSRWLSVGGRWENIELISCDPGSNEAVVRVGGDLRKLSLRKATTAKSPRQGPAVVPPPQVSPPPPRNEAAQQPPPPPENAVAKTNEEKEREARMFVSDMLEISMKQRKAYEEARKKAEQEASQKKR